MQWQKEAVFLQTKLAAKFQKFHDKYAIKQVKLGYVCVLTLWKQIYFLLDSGEMANELARLKILLDQKLQNTVPQYIDLRFGEKVYYKWSAEVLLKINGGAAEIG